VPEEESIQISTNGTVNDTISPQNFSIRNQASTFVPEEDRTQNDPNGIPSQEFSPGNQSSNIVPEEDSTQNDPNGIPSQEFSPGNQSSNAVPVEDKTQIDTNNTLNATIHAPDINFELKDDEVTAEQGIMNETSVNIKSTGNGIDFEI
jgi:hypothetical protein